MTTHHLLVTMDYPPVPGGISLYLSKLWEHVCFDRSVLMTGASDSNPCPTPYPILHARLPSGSNPAIRMLRVALMLPLLLRTITGRNNLIIHCGQVFVCGFPAALISIFTGLRFVVYTYAADVYACQKRPLQAMALRLILKRAILTVTISNYTKNILLASGCPDQNLVLIAPGVDPPPDVSAQIRAALKERIHRPDARIILTVARIVRRKGHETIINAMPAIIKTHPDCVYVIAGDGPYKSELLKMVAANALSDHVIFLDHVSDGERCALYELCDIFALVPYEDTKQGEVEGFGIVYLEANSFGKPVIASRSGGIPDAVEHDVSGLMITQRDEEAFAQAAVRLLSDPALAVRLGTAGKQRLARFTWPEKAISLERALREKVPG